MFTAKRGVLEPYGYELITMAGAGHEIRILPQNGFNLYYWTFEGKEILMTPVDVTIFGTKYGTPILFPTPNRVKDGAYTWRGKRYEMKKRGEKVIIHGLVKDEPFCVTALRADENGASCTAKIEIRSEGSIYEGWPWDCTLEVTYALDAQGVHMDVKAVNESAEDMPFGFAIHPYFSKRGDANRCFIRVPVRRVYEADENRFPSGRIVPAPADKMICEDFCSVESLYLDDVYRGMTADMESLVRYDDVMVHISGSDCLRNAVVYTPHDRPGFCIEPQTNATNFLNLHAQGLADESGLLVLPAGKTFACQVNMTVSRR